MDRSSHLIYKKNIRMWKFLYSLFFILLTLDCCPLSNSTNLKFYKYLKFYKCLKLWCPYRTHLNSLFLFQEEANTSPEPTEYTIPPTLAMPATNNILITHLHIIHHITSISASNTVSTNSYNTSRPTAQQQSLLFKILYST